MISNYRKVRRWTLQLRQRPPAQAPGATDFTGSIVWQRELSVTDYLLHYRAVGERWNWFDRVLMPSQELQQLLAEPNRHIGLLQPADCDSPAGFTEFKVHSATEAEICYFGLRPEFTGNGLGTPFFRMLLIHVAGLLSGEGKIWLTTCAWDSPAALPFYQKMGFVVTGEDFVRQQVPDGFAGPAEND